VLSQKEAARLYEKMTDRKRKKGGAVSSPSPAKKPKNKKARMIKEEQVDPDLQVSSGDGIGVASL
jgi:hypothetical protein